VLLGFKTEFKLNDRVRTDFWKPTGAVSHPWNWGLALTQQVFDRNVLNRIAISRQANRWDFSLTMGAMNLKKAASQVVSACGLGEADFSKMKQEVSTQLLGSQCS
jgi:hypothetical protein